MTDIDDAAEREAQRAPRPEELQQRLPHELAELTGGRAVVLRIVRHAETEYNVAHRMQGWSD